MLASPSSPPAVAPESPVASPAPESAKLGWILVRNRWISAAQLQTALTQQAVAPQSRLGEVLLQRTLISEAQLQQALREQYWRRNGYWVI